MTTSIRQFYDSTIGKKVIVALTGLMMVLWLMGHMAGNLQIFAGPGTLTEDALINQYAKMLHDNQALLWIVRVVMFGAIALHIANTVQLTIRNRQARPMAYHTKKSIDATLASRTMFFGGLTILFFIIYHLLHFTFQEIHTDLLSPDNLYQSMVSSFQSPLISGVYFVAQLALLMHLIHGVQSVARTLGMHNEKHLSVVKYAGTLIAFAIVLGFVSIPLAVLSGVIS